MMLDLAKNFGHSLDDIITEVAKDAANRFYFTNYAGNDMIFDMPGIYLPDRGGIRIEDMILVTEDGYKNLTNFNKEYTTI